VAEIARHPPKTREVFTKRVEQIMALIAAQLEGSAAEQRRKAMAIYSMMIGALQVARAVNDKKLSDEMLESAIEGALALAER
jgi:hypothetical protein